MDPILANSTPSYMPFPATCMSFISNPKLGKELIRERSTLPMTTLAFKLSSMAF